MANTGPGAPEERKQMGLTPTRILVSVPLGEFSWCKEADTHCLKERRGTELRSGYGWVGRKEVGPLGEPQEAALRARVQDLAALPPESRTRALQHQHLHQHLHLHPRTPGEGT